MSELKPCPFCGDSAFFYPDGDTEGHSVMCRGVADPSCASNTFGYSTEAEAIAAWNRRAQPAAPAVSWRDHVEQRLHSWRSTTMNADGDCVSLSDYLNWETMDDLIDFVCDESAGPAAPADAAPSVAPTAELWMYDFTDDGKPVKDWTTSSREEAFAPGHFNQRRYGPEQPAVPQDRTRSKDDLWRVHSTGPSPHWNVVLSAAAFHKARAVAGTQSTAEDAALYRGIQAYMHHSMPPDAAPSVAPEPVAWTLQSELDAAQTTCSAHLWFTNPRNSAWTALFTREQIAAHPPRAPLTEEIESADNLLRHLGLDPERCRTVGGSLNVSRIKTLLADAAPTARESAMEELLRSAAAIAQRHGAGTAWDRFGASIKALGIGAITARTYRLLPSDTERQQPPTTDPSRLADDLSNIGTMSPRIRKLYDDAAAFIRSTQAPLTPWQPMKTAPKDGAAVLVLLDASDIPHAARWLSGPDDRRATEETTRAGWHLTWDGSPIEEHDGPRYWMHCPDDPDESDIEAAHGIGGKE